MIRRRIILLILCAIGCLTSASFFSLLLYFDPYIHTSLAIGLLVLCFILGVTSLVGVILYFFKKIYYRGEVSVYHVFSSLRQSFFGALWAIGFGVIISFNIPYLLPAALLCCMLVFLELFIQNL